MSRALPAELLTFLAKLKRNNNRDWFQKHKSEYEASVRDPLIQFIRDFAPKLEAISPHFVADDRTNGGSLFRIYRDTRFSNDKTPYKTWAAVQFRHEKGKDVHAPGFYLHIQPGSIYVGCGIWHPDGKTLKSVRDAIVDKPAEWKRAKGGKVLQEHFEQGGDSLKRPPRGYDPDHPLIEDLKRKDFVIASQMSEGDFLAKNFVTTYAARLRVAAPFMEFLTKAVGLKW